MLLHFYVVFDRISCNDCAPCTRVVQFTQQALSHATSVSSVNLSLKASAVLAIRNIRQYLPLSQGPRLPELQSNSPLNTHKASKTMCLAPAAPNLRASVHFPCDCNQHVNRILFNVNDAERIMAAQQNRLPTKTSSTQTPIHVGKCMRRYTCTI